MTPIRLRIHEARTAKGWSQEELARRVGIRQATISGLETGKTQRVDLPVLEKIASVLGIDMASLLESVPKARKR